LGSRELSAKLKDLEIDLADNIRLVGAIAGPVMPTTGYIIMEEADGFTNAALKLAVKNPRILKALETAAQVGPGVKVGKTLVKIGIAINVDTGRMNHDAIISRYFGVDDAWKTVHPDMTENGKANFTPAPRYSVVE
jgi:hypothetical protein